MDNLYRGFHLSILLHSKLCTYIHVFELRGTLIKCCDNSNNSLRNAYSYNSSKEEIFERLTLHDSAETYAINIQNTMIYRITMFKSNLTPSVAL